MRSVTSCDVSQTKENRAMTKKHFSFSEGKSRCDECGRTFVVKETTRRLAQDTSNPLFVAEVIGHFAKQYGQSLAMCEFVCPECVQTRWDEILDANSMQDDGRGHFILSDNDEFFGRREDEAGGGSVVTRPGRTGSHVTQTKGSSEGDFSPFTNQYAVVMEKGDYKGKGGMATGEVVKGYWRGIRIVLQTGRTVDVQPTSFRKV
jgi:hypothetical protein